VLAGEEALMVVVEPFGAEEELLEVDLVEEAGACVAGVAVGDLAVEVAVLGCAGDGPAGPSDDVPGQGAA
jgi:hypothetical protein